MGNEQSSGLSGEEADASSGKISRLSKRQPSRSTCALSVSEASSPQIAQEEDVLSAFQPRKQPLQQRASNVTTTNSSESPGAGSGNEITSQNARPGNPGEKDAARKKPKQQANDRTASTALPFNPPSGPKSMERGVARNKTNEQARPPAPSAHSALNRVPKRPAPAPSDFTDERRPSSSNLHKIAKRTSNASPQLPQPNGARPKPANATGASSERPATTQSAIKHERRPALSELPKIAKKTSVASPQSPQDEQANATDTSSERPPKWYGDLKYKDVRDKNFTNADTLLERLREEVRKCPTSDSRNRNAVLDKIREMLHIIVFVEVTADLLKTKRMLDNNGTLAQIFDDQHSKGVNWPFDIKADARELYNKWCDRVFETDLLRGIKFQVKSASDKKDGQKTTDSLDRNYPATRADYHGNGKLLNGQWWPLQICTLRDGAHGASQGGIYGKNEDCAYSVITSGGTDSTGKKYPDVDDGDDVRYCGTDSVNGKVSEYTQQLIRCSEVNQPVRFIRSSNLESQYKPEKGFRYDGLYDVVSFENLDKPDSTRQRHQFRLKRQAGQDPIRALGVAKRPTTQEVEQYEKHKRLAGKIKDKASA